MNEDLGVSHGQEGHHFSCVGQVVESDLGKSLMW